MEIAHHNYFFFIHFIILIIDVDLLNFRIIRMTKTFTPEFECDFDMQGLANHQCNFPFIKKTADLKCQKS